MELISEQKEHSDHLLDCISALQDRMEVLNQVKILCNVTAFLLSIMEFRFHV